MFSRRVSGWLALFTLACGALKAAPVNFKGYSFDAYVTKSSGSRYREFQENGRPTLKVRPDEEYSIVIHNPLPVRAGVAVSVDGLNSIDGKRTSPRMARKWIIEPNSSITIAGWQTGGETRRNFVFTPQDASFAQWQESKEGKPYTKNLGVIGVAWFWNDGELQAALHPPQPFADEASVQASSRDRQKSPAAAPSNARAESQAGTGMGRQERNVVTTVEFDPTAGMFSVKDVLKLFYEFAKDSDEPLPFVNEGDDDGRFTPDMHK